jgi:hypothetical protein
MASIENLLAELDNKTLARKIEQYHTDAISKYVLKSSRVDSFEEFSLMIGDYYNYHFTRCISNGGKLSKTEATDRAKEIIKKEYGRRGQDIVSAYNDAHDGTNGGLFGILSIIADRLKTEAVERWIREVFDRHVAPNSWEQKVEILKKFIAYCGPSLSRYIEPDYPQRYASNYEAIVRGYVRARQEISSILDRL